MMLVGVIVLLLIILLFFILLMMSGAKQKTNEPIGSSASVVTEPVTQAESEPQQEEYTESVVQQSEEYIDQAVTEAPLITVYETQPTVTEPYYTKKTGSQKTVITTRAEITRITTTTTLPPIETTPQYQRISFSSDLSGVTASSKLASQNFGGEIYDYSPEKTIDKNLKTCWSEGSSEYGIGEYITFKFRDTRLIEKIDLWNGLCSNEELFYKNSRLRSITIVLSDGQAFDYECADGWDNRENIIVMPQSAATSSVTIVINSVYKGDEYKDTCISELSIS